LDSSKGILKIFININGEKVNSDNENEPNFYTILLKNIQVKNEFQDFTFKIVNNIEMNLSMKVKNIIGGGGLASRMNMFSKKSDDSNTSKNIISTGANMSVKDRLKLLKNLANQPKPEPKNVNAPKKMIIPTEFTKTMSRHLPQSNIKQNDEIEDKKKEDKNNIEQENINKENKENKEKNETVN
jgi:ABC-type antimicrobial peptide transport system permease subunit